mmetsp:Transcript_7548/g.20695  ORF Transcript_7548/g.20695 Transcript_7548/m.20695 type:complete len:424 (+) Transcript_7548:47-1318(+)
MPPVLVQTINGITYPREVPVPEGLPAGWVGVEQAYGPNSKSAGQTYVRYKSLDGRHRQIMGPKQVVQKHCEDHGLSFEVEYKKYEDALKAKHDREAAERAKERESRGQAEGEKREEMIALSRAHFGELTGPMCLAFPGWKCRWDYLPDSQQTPKCFIADDGLEWKLLKDIECMFGTRLTQGGDKAEKIKKMVEAGKQDTAAQALFSLGAKGAKECMGSYLIDPANPDQEIVETAEERMQRKSAKVEARGKKRSALSGGKDSLHGFSPSVHPSQTGWAALASQADLETGFAKFRDLLVQRKFSPDVGLIAVHTVSEDSRFASRISGIYYEMPVAVSGRRCYQKLLFSSRFTVGCGCDGVYILWIASASRWQISTQPSEGAPCIAYNKDDQELVWKIASSWYVQQQGHGDFEEDKSLKIMTDVHK